MKTLAFLKLITLSMAALIIAGTILISHKIANSGRESKSFSTVEREILLSYPEKVEMMSACGEKVCLLVQGNQLRDRLLIIEPKTGKMERSIILKEVNDINQKLTDSSVK